jgi:hypothetical protein
MRLLLWRTSAKNHHKPVPTNMKQYHRSLKRKTPPLKNLSPFLAKMCFYNITPKRRLCIKLKANTAGPTRQVNNVRQASSLS